ncbi:MAG: glycosyltransferase [Bacteroidota bacterium]|jgi:cellulose synthase/poly-beta-1,6-N-acetylglucosamine synthase-like glycosyltransferase
MQFFPTFDSLSSTILFGFFCFAALIQLLHTLRFHGRLAFFKERATLEESELPPVSVIIAARNEADNLFENLPFILEQNYPEFEVIVINHQSIDESSHLLAAYQRQYPNLRVTEVARSPHLRLGKKLPITLGVKGAKYEHLILTDADCKPASNNWLKSMAGRFTAGKEIVLGYGPYVKRSGFLNSLIRFDTTWIGMNYLSFALAGKPYMGVGRNLAYTKELFYHVHGFKSHYSLPSGDDDLFIQEAARKRNHRIDIEKDAFCYSESADTWKAWARQKSRHYTTSPKYRVIKKLLLGIYPMTMLLMMASFVTLLFSTDFRWITLSVFAIVFAIKWLVQGRSFAKLGEKGFIGYLPLWDLFYTLLIPVLYYSAEKKRKNKW